MRTSTSATAADLNAGLVVADGMKGCEQWDGMSFDERVAWLAELAARGPLFVRAQASVFALVSQRTVRQIVNAWLYHGYLSDEQARTALAGVRA